MTISLSPKSNSFATNFGSDPQPSQSQPTLQPPPELDSFLVDKILPDFGISVFASADVDITVLLIQLLREWSLGRGLYSHASHPAPCVILTNRPSDLQLTMEVLGFSCPLISIWDLNRSRSSRPNLEAVIKSILKKHPDTKLIVLDSIYSFAPPSINSELKVSRFLREVNGLCDRLGITILATAHSTRSKYLRERLAGSPAWPSGIETIFLLDRLELNKFQLSILPMHARNEVFTLEKGERGELHVIAPDKAKPKRKKCRRVRVRKFSHNGSVESTAALESKAPEGGSL
jgi:hypothetical protein